MRMAPPLLNPCCRSFRNRELNVALARTHNRPVDSSFRADARAALIRKSNLHTQKASSGPHPIDFRVTPRNALRITQRRKRVTLRERNEAGAAALISTTKRRGRSEWAAI